jgi:hypothetical protein
MGERNKVYVVSGGERDEHEVKRVFSSREKAEAWLGGKPECGNHWIEEFVLDIEDGSVVREFWTARLILETGEFKWHSYTDQPGDFDLTHTDTKSSRAESYVERMKGWTGGPPGRPEVHPSEIWAFSSISIEDAKRVAVEERQKWLNEKPQ